MGRTVSLQKCDKITVTAPYPAPCGAAAPAVPAASCRRLSVSLSAVSLAYSAFHAFTGRAVLPISKSKGRGASPLPLRPAPVPAPVCAVLLRWIGSIGGSCNEKRPYRSRSVRFVYSNFSENVQCVRSAYGYVISAFAKSKCLYFIVLKDNGTFLWV